MRDAIDGIADVMRSSMADRKRDLELAMAIQQRDEEHRNFLHAVEEMKLAQASAVQSAQKLAEANDRFELIIDTVYTDHYFDWTPAGKTEAWRDGWNDCLESFSNDLRAVLKSAVNGSAELRPAQEQQQDE